MNILITSAGRRVQLLKLLQQSAQTQFNKATLFACDVEPEWSSACNVADISVKCPRADHPDYIDFLLKYCRDNDIALLVPTIDPELLPLAVAREQFKELGTHVSVSDAELVRLSRDKCLTMDFLQQNGITIPETVDLDNTPYRSGPSPVGYPAIAKPKSGSSSIGIIYIDEEADLTALTDKQEYLLQERLQGTEFTANVYFDKSSKLIATVPHIRHRVRGGEVEKATTEKIDAIDKIATALEGSNVGLRGALCFQGIITADNQIYIFEINARFGGGYPIAHAAGATFTDWLVQEASGADLVNIDATWKSGVRMMRHDTEIFAGT